MPTRKRHDQWPDFGTKLFNLKHAGGDVEVETIMDRARFKRYARDCVKRRTPERKCALQIALWMYTVRMKRTNLVLDPELLDRATRLLGVKTYSATVNLALAEVLRLRKIQSIPLFFGQGLWQGDLAEMREDFVPRQKKSRPRGRR